MEFIMYLSSLAAMYLLRALAGHAVFYPPTPAIFVPSKALGVGGYTAVSFSITFSAKPTAGAYTELLFCLKYLTDTQHLRLLLKRGEPDRYLVLTCYVDASNLTQILFWIPFIL